MKRRSGSLWLTALVLAFAGFGQLARGQDDADAEEEQPARPRHGLFASDEQFEQWFDRWAFGLRPNAADARAGRVSGQVGAAAEARDRLESQLAAKIRYLDRMYGLTVEQKMKLGLAGKRDIQRFFDSTDEIKKRLKEARGDRDQFVAILNERNREFLVRRQGGDNLFGDGSLLAKTLRRILANGVSFDGATEPYRACAEAVVSRFDEEFGLAGDQHRRLVKLIVEETRPLEQYGKYNAFAVIFQLSRLPEDKLARILNPVQMRRLRDRFLEARTYEKVLIANGYLAGIGAEGNRPGVADRERAKPKQVDIRIARPAPRR
jgi:hypothetical protein